MSATAKGPLRARSPLAMLRAEWMEANDAAAESVGAVMTNIAAWKQKATGTAIRRVRPCDGRAACCIDLLTDGPRGLWPHMRPRQHFHAPMAEA
mmetsp:Transcript_57228/g.100194  ORF Transcript_57228/g.100194 Transcript_57228/m.100194 type:complete len:94 (-) Transcript_57228:1-282(-)